MTKREPILMDTTLRDGSYAVDFQFSADDTGSLVAALDTAGIRYIEVGHGLGLGAYRKQGGMQGATDEAYLDAARTAVQDAKFGAFFVSGIGTRDDLVKAASLGADFIRIGSELKDLPAAAVAIEKAKSLGLMVFCNLMKSYAVPAAEFSSYARTAERLGADAVYVVDSAGAMLPEEVGEYVQRATDACTIPVGFHGHDNLSLAVANSLVAFAAGATFVDGTLMGIGRSEGNAVLEILAAVLQKQGMLRGVDINALLDASEEHISSLMHGPRHTALGIAAGRAQFHSSHLGSVLAAARTHDIDPRDLMLRLAKYDVVQPSQELIECVARDLAREAVVEHPERK